MQQSDHRPGAWVGEDLSFYELRVKTFYEVLRKYNVSESLSGVAIDSTHHAVGLSLRIC
ncbi:MAG: hypothetical protein QOF24_16 [Verrucomicrobiota bacterium]|jgi:hypothetical protein